MKLSVTSTLPSVKKQKIITKLFFTGLVISILLVSCNTDDSLNIEKKDFHEELLLRDSDSIHYENKDGDTDPPKGTFPPPPPPPPPVPPHA